MRDFENAVIAALMMLPKDYWQRVDGLLTEPVVMRVPDPWFRGVRLWWLERRGLIESRRSGHSRHSLKSYRLRMGVRRTLWSIFTAK